VEGADEVLVDKLIALGIISVLDLSDVGPDPLVSELKMEPDFAERLVDAADREAKLAAAAESERKQAERELAQQSRTVDAGNPERDE
jgi:hypothetical protein